MPLDAPLSVVTVELLPEPNSPFGDPLGQDLGQVRILRTTPLAASAVASGGGIGEDAVGGAAPKGRLFCLSVLRYV